MTMLDMKKTLTLGLGVRQQEVSWRVCTESGTPGRHLSAGCGRSGQRCGVPAGPQHPDTNEDSQSLREQRLQLCQCVVILCFFFGLGYK